MPRKKALDSLTEAQVEVAQMKRDQQKLKELEQQEKEKLIAQCHELAGRIQVSSMMAKFGVTASLAWLKEVKESKVYKQVPKMGSWERFCNYLGMSRRKVDEDLQNLDVFGEDFLRACRQFSVSQGDLRKLRKSVGSGEINITSESLEIDGEKIPFDADHKGDLAAAIEKIIEQKEEEVQQREKDAKKKEKLSAETVKGLEIERDALVRDNQRLKVFEEKPRSDEDMEWCFRQAKEIMDACVAVKTLCKKFMFDERLKGNEEEQTRVTYALSIGLGALSDIREDWGNWFTPNDFE